MHSDAAMQKVQQALPLVFANLPYLAGLGYAVEYRADDRVNVAAVTESGRILVNSEVFRDLPLADAAYVLAHELLHLALDTFGRSAGADAELSNYAHDYVINDLLSKELEMRPPLGGLHWPGASEHSFEQVVRWMQTNESPRIRYAPSGSWNLGQVPVDHPLGLGLLGVALHNAGITADVASEKPVARPAKDPRIPSGDMIPLVLERELFGEPLPEIERRRELIRLTAAESAALQALAKRLSDKVTHHPGQARGEWEHGVAALEGYYHTPWELALQRWADSIAPQARSYSRPSRRGAASSDCIRPGRIRAGWTLHIVLDTSGSMISEWPDMLGAITSFCRNAGVDQVHILQCDTEVSLDEFVDVDALTDYRIQGLGGSDMSPAMLRLADDSEVTAAVVLTDGYIDYPPEPPPYRVLWVVPKPYKFQPPYGEVLFLRP